MQGPGSSVAIGYQALQGTGVDASTAIGYRALNAATADYNTALGFNAGDTLTSGTYNILIGQNVEPASTTDSYQLVVGSHATTWRSVDAISGYMGALSDTDMSDKLLTLTGPSALPTASTNQSGGDLVLRGGQKASGPIQLYLGFVRASIQGNCGRGRRMVGWARILGTPFL